MKKIFALVCMVTLSVVAYANYEKSSIHLMIDSSNDSVTVSVENDTIGVIGVLRKPNKIDNQYHLFTEAKFIRVALSGNAKNMRFCYEDGFYATTENNKTKEANGVKDELGPNVRNRSAGFIKKESLSNRTFTIHNKTQNTKLDFVLSLYDKWNLDKLQLEVYRKHDTISSPITYIESEFKTKVFASGDTISLKVRKDHIGSRIIGVWANGEKLEGNFKYQKEKEKYKEDDLAIKPTAFFTDKFVLPIVEDSTNFTIKVQYEYISNFRLVSEEKDLTITVVPKVEEQSKVMIWAIIIGPFVLLTAVFVWWSCKKKYKKIVKEEAKKTSKDVTSDTRNLDAKLANNKGKNKLSSSQTHKNDGISNLLKRWFTCEKKDKIDKQDDKSSDNSKNDNNVGIFGETNNNKDVKNNELEKENKELLERISNLEKENESVRNQFKEKEEQLLQLNTTIEQIKKEKQQVSERLEKQKKEIDGLKKDIELKDIHIKENNKTIQEKQDLINTLQTEKENLEKRISEELLVERYKFANSLMQKQNAIKDLIQTMFNEIVEDENSIYYNRVKRINKDFSRFIDRINSLNIQESQISIKEIKKSVQDCVIPSMLEDGWINTTYVVNEYMKASNNLYNEFSIIGVSGVLLHKLIASINEYLGMVGIKVLLPYLMVEDFNREEYEYEEERWIHRFDTNISEQFVSDKIVDISRIGYQIEGQEIVKPKVNYTF